MMTTKSKIFISYTTTDGKINTKFLNEICNKIPITYVVYIDLIHNNSINKQARVIRELKSSDLIFLIRTEQVDKSIWVNKEVSLAKKLNIPIIEFEYDELVKNEFSPIIKIFESTLK